ncbi:3'-5' exonuclease [Nocardia cyriacigeorgica]|uniref:DNA 3'-5' helicase n=1 Tax=Nocardia cyriacigeorgica TaxID=135487 RepID=A0A5R8NXQ7_9NOCA|nr:3'-5' exonuclease [Nocardia cyriacigeorgica]TLF80940.1 DNA helicase UvrD [Nocardia cyriacigeorgica]
MADIVLARITGARQLSTAAKSKIYDFLDHLRTADGSAAASYLEQVDNARDQRVRLGRIDSHHSAIVFRIDPAEGNTTYIFTGAWKHEDARAAAQNSILRVNPVSGVLECAVDGSSVRANISARPEYRDHDAVEVARPPTSILTGFGHTAGDLVDHLGLDRAIAERALAATDHTTLADIAHSAGVEAGSWQSDVLLDLAAGGSVADIRQRYHLGTTGVDNALDEERQIVAALDHPTSKMHFAYIGDDTQELRRVIEEGDFTAWRTFLHPVQRRYAERHYNGVFRLSGGAGTGKTVVLIHRAHRLWKRNPNARILLTTFNTGLAQVLEQNLRILDPDVALARSVGSAGIYVRSIDKLAHDIVNHADDLDNAVSDVLGTRTSAALRARAGNRTIHDAWSRAMKSTGLDKDPDPQVRSAEFLDSEYVNVFLARRVRTKADYLRLPRRGRKVRLTRAQRIRVWQTVEEFREICRRRRFSSYPEVLAVAAECLRLRAETTAERIADHILVDEGQDLTATHWMFLRAMADEGPDDLFVAEDPHQRIFTEPLCLSDLGINIVGRSRRLTLNYRTTEQTLRFAVNLLADGSYLDLEGELDSTTGYRSARLGPPPVILTLPASEELSAIAARLREWLAAGHAPNTLAVLTRSRQRRKTVTRYLCRHGIDAAEYEEHSISAGYVPVLTMHRAKGMEFSRVILTGVGPQFTVAPGKDVIEQSENPNALLRERSLLYVSASRARDELVVIQRSHTP